jgi:hypothetical protein
MSANTEQTTTDLEPKKKKKKKKKGKFSQARQIDI